MVDFKESCTVSKMNSHSLTGNHIFFFTLNSDHELPCQTTKQLNMCGAQTYDLHCHKKKQKTKCLAVLSVRLHQSKFVSGVYLRTVLLLLELLSRLCGVNTVSRPDRIAFIADQTPSACALTSPSLKLWWERCCLRKEAWARVSVAHKKLISQWWHTNFNKAWQKSVETGVRIFQYIDYIFILYSFIILVNIQISMPNIQE